MGRMLDLDAPLLKLAPSDHLTLRDAMQGVLVMGGIGSGKTSGTGKALAEAYLKAGMGGLVLCAKPEEADLWRDSCQRHGRGASLIMFDGEKHGFNFIAYELARHGVGGLNAVVECLMRILEIARTASPSGGKPGESFWEDTTRQILRNAIPVLYAATGTVRIGDLLQFVRSAPTTPDQMRDPEWQHRSFFFAIFAQAADRLDDATGERAVAYWQHDFATLDTKTRGNITISLTTALDRFNHGWLQRAFCSDTSVVPELTFHGAIIVLSMPALTRNEDGIIAQQLFKYLWQRAVLARNGLAADQQERPVFLWADEAQYFVNSYDAEFLSTCRGSRACVVFLSQSLPTFYAKMGGDNARDRVHHLLGNFATRVWHNNACHETNGWASQTVGKTLQRRGNYSEGEGTNTSFGTNMGEGENIGGSQGSGSSYGGSSGNGQSSSSWSTSTNHGTSWGSNDSWGRNRGHGSSSNVSQGFSEQMDDRFTPGFFSSALMTGGPANGNRVSALWFQAGRKFQDSRANYLLTVFAQ